MPMQHVSHEAAPPYVHDGHSYQPVYNHDIATINEQNKGVYNYISVILFWFLVNAKEQMNKSLAPSKGAETDEEKKNIKSTLSKIDSPRIVKLSHNWAIIKWNKVRSDEKSDLNEENLSYILEIRNTTSAQDDAWKLVYQGLKLEYEVAKLIPENNYLSRVKARYLNIEGDPSQVQNFRTEAISKNNIDNREKSPEIHRPHKVKYRNTRHGLNSL